MSYTIAIAGKGGVGKTTISALLIQHLADTNGPVLAVDADPNANLNVLLGLAYEETLSDIREEAKKLTSVSLSKSEFFDMKLQEIVVEGKGLDLLVMGRPEGPGCYCAVNNILREFLLKLSKNYNFIVIDNEAGMEHLSRRVANDIDRLLLISDTTMIALQSAINAFNTAKKAGIKVKKTSILINRSKTPLSDKKLKLIKDAGLNIMGYIDFLEEIRDKSEFGRRIGVIKNKELIAAFEKV